MARIPWRRTIWVGIFCVSHLCGCSLWPFAETERTSYVTPAKQVAAIESLAEQASAKSTQEQQQLSVELAQQIQTESDPLVREAIVRAVAQMNTPLADRMLLAALDDADLYVRQTACKLLGRRGDASAVAALGNTAQSDPEIDVRLAATRALGELGDPAAIVHLSSGLHDADPALQLASVESLKEASGQDLGNDVGVWREWIASRNSTTPQAAVAGRASGPPGS